MVISERQNLILNKIIEEYIDSAQPVSSQLLEKKYDFGICPATIRIEMQKLTEAGLISQPHTSAGREPTDRGYRFFVDGLLKRGFLREDFDLKIEDWLAEEMGGTLKLIQSVTKNLASLSSNLALGYLPDEKIFWKEGWEDILQKPEFKETRLISNFAELLKNFEDEIEDLKLNSEMKIYIGKENPFPKAKEFSIIITRCQLPKEEGILGILGPKRMAYDRNISLIKSVTKILEKF